MCLDADDRIAPPYIESCVSHLKAHPETKVVVTRCRFFGTTNAELPMNYDPESFRWGNSITSASMYRRTTYDTSPGYDEALRFGYEDWDFYLSIVRSKSDVHIVNEPLFFYRRKPKNVASMVKTIEDHAQQTLRHIYNNHRELYATDADQLLYFHDRWLYYEDLYRKAVDSRAYKFGKFMAQLFNTFRLPFSRIIRKLR